MINYKYACTFSGAVGQNKYIKEIKSDIFFKIQTENKLGDSKIRVPAGFEPVGAPGLKFEKISDMQTIIPVKHLIDIQSF